MPAFVLNQKQIDTTVKALLLYQRNLMNLHPVPTEEEEKKMIEISQIIAKIKDEL
jgi:hypothetical protein